MKLTNLILFVFLSITITAQTKTTVKQLDALPNTIENQFFKIITKAKNWHEFKMIEKPKFVVLQKNILDSIATIKKDLTDKNNIIEIKKKENTVLNERISLLEKDLSVALENEDAISFLGVQVNKGVYNTILFSIIAGLLIGLLFFIFKFKNGTSVTNEAKNTLKETENELDDYRKKSIEKEQKLRRQLQDEINKQRGV